MQGILLVDKPQGWTSFDVVNYVRKIVATAEGKKPKNCKVGHTGTLDPMATGLLVLLVGKDYTRRAGAMSKHDKTYEVTIKLGFISDTGDAEGTITPYNAPSASGSVLDAAAQGGEGLRQGPSLTQVGEVLQRFTGKIMQTPPAYSAIKINGQKAYDLARKGKEVKLEPRPVTIYDIRDIKYEYPLLSFTCDVSSGTYIRSLAADIGETLATGAYLTALRRTRVGEYGLTAALQKGQLEAEAIRMQVHSFA